TNLIGGVLFPGLSMRLRWEDETSGHRYYTTMDSESVQDANDLDGKPWPWVFGISMRDYDHERHGEGLRIVLFAQRRFAALLVIAGIATAIWSVFGFAISWFISSLVS
ncbi:MAG: hypothetical protein HYS44_00025, partial [Candidatus Niyogibacteria bacterium]|nr:hypothetical protein [Candidatus Niyogibacteria bacterium]